MASYLTIFTPEPERLWTSLLATSERMDAEVSGSPPDFAISLGRARLFFYSSDDDDPLPDAIRPRPGSVWTQIIMRYRGPAAEELLAAAIDGLELFVEDDYERLMTSVEFARRTRAWLNRRQRWSPRSTDQERVLVPLLAYAGDSVSPATVRAAAATAEALAKEREDWVVASPELVDEVDHDGFRTVALVLWLAHGYRYRKRRFRRPKRIDEPFNDAAAQDAQAFVDGLERMTANTGSELELELAGDRVGQIEPDGESGEFTDLISMWRDRVVPAGALRGRLERRSTRSHHG